MINDNIRRYRKEKGLSQEEMAVMYGRLFQNGKTENPYLMPKC